MAAHLQCLGLRPGSRIALFSKNTAHWLMADLAIWMAGYVSVPLYPDPGGRHHPPDPRAQRSRSCCSSASSTAGTA